MNETIPITYVKCSFCTARNHCDGCGAELSAALSEKAGILYAAADMKTKSLQITYTIHHDALEDLLDGMGVMTD